jgi:hypothetical protein
MAALQNPGSGVAVDADALAIDDEAVASGALPGAAACRPVQGWRRSLGDGCFPGDAAARRASATSPSRWKISQGRALRRLGTDGGENQPALEPRRAQAGPTPSATVRTQYASKGPAGLADRLDAAVVGANRSNERAASMARKPGRRSTRTWCQSLLPRVRQPRHEAPRRRPAHRRTRAGPARSGDCDR